MACCNVATVIAQSKTTRESALKDDTSLDYRSVQYLTTTFQALLKEKIQPEELAEELADDQGQR